MSLQTYNRSVKSVTEPKQPMNEVQAMTVIQGICLIIIILSLISATYVIYVTKKSIPTNDPLIEYERICNECGAGCYHYAYESESYDISKPIYCGKHSHMYK